MEASGTHLLRFECVVIGLSGDAAEVQPLSVAQVHARPLRCPTKETPELEAVRANAANAAVLSSARAPLLHPAEQ